jgi:hypothetical protein
MLFAVVIAVLGMLLLHEMDGGGRKRHRSGSGRPRL